MSKLSISKAWDETTRVFAHDGKLITNVALALMVLPQTIAGAIAPPETLSGATPPPWTGLVMLAVLILGIAGELAIMRLALGRSSVGEAISRGGRRVLPALVALALLVIALTIVLVPLMFAIAGPEGIRSLAADRPTPAAGGAVFIALLICLFAAPKFQLILPAAAGEEGGPIHLLRRGWQLSDGAYWKLLGFLVLILIVAIVVVLFLGQMLVGILIRTLFDTVDPLSLGALLAALLTSAIGAAFGAVASVMQARIYVQLAERGGVSVPRSGT